MRPVLVKAYGALNPATEETYRAVRAVLEDWYIPDAVELKGDLLRISYEGEVFTRYLRVGAPSLSLRSERRQARHP